MGRLSIDFNTTSIKTFSALQHIRLHVNAPVQQRMMSRRAEIFSKLITLAVRFQSGKKTGLHFLWFCKRLLRVSKHTASKKVVRSRSDSVPPNNGASYWRRDFFLPFLFTSSTLYLKTCSLYRFIAKTVCKARIVLIPSKLINVTCFSIISTIWACWKP